MASNKLGDKNHETMTAGIQYTMHKNNLVIIYLVKLAAPMILRFLMLSQPNFP